LRPKRAASRFLLSGITFCGHCGKALVGQDAKSGRFSYYVCGTLNKKGAGSCPAHYFSSRKFEEAVIRAIKDNVLTEDHLTQLVNLVNEEMNLASKEQENELRAVEGELADTQRRLESLYYAVETGQIPLEDLATQD